MCSAGFSDSGDPVVSNIHKVTPWILPDSEKDKKQNQTEVKQQLEIGW